MSSRTVGAIKKRPCLKPNKRKKLTILFRIWTDDILKLLSFCPNPEDLKGCVDFLSAAFCPPASLTGTQCCASDLPSALVFFSSIMFISPHLLLKLEFSSLQVSFCLSFGLYSPTIPIIRTRVVYKESRHLFVQLKW